jgi:hemoglobin
VVSAEPGQTFYDAVGGHETFRRLVDRFYQGVAEDPQLRPMYPEADLGPAGDRLRIFLEQYWGGPRTYSERRGHPRLRMRHVPFAVTPAARDRWLAHMRVAVDELELDPELDAMLWNYFTMAAQTMVNTPGPEPTEGTQPGSATSGPAGPASFARPVTLSRRPPR